MPVARCHEGAAIALPAVVEMEVLQSARRQIESRRHGASARHQQRVRRGHQRTLRRHTGEGRRAVRLLDEIRARAVIHPHDLASFRVERIQEGAHERPDARRKEHLPVTNHRTATRRPRGDKAAVPKCLPFRGSTAEGPQLLTILGVHAVEMAVIASDVNFALPAHRRQTHRPAGEKAPQLRARVQIQRHHLVGIVEADEHPVPEHDGLEDTVVSHEIVIQRIVPHLLARRVCPLPFELKLCGQLLRGSRRSSGIKPPHGPVGGCGCSDEQKKTGGVVHGAHRSGQMIDHHHKGWALRKLRTIPRSSGLHVASRAA